MEPIGHPTQGRRGHHVVSIVHGLGFRVRLHRSWLFFFFFGGGGGYGLESSGVGSLGFIGLGVKSCAMNATIALSKH